MKFLHLATATSLVFLAGCTTTQGRAPLKLPPWESSIAAAMAGAVPSHCHIFRHLGDGKPIDDAKLTVTQPVEIRRFFVSTTDWYKAIFIAQGVWGEGYYNSTSKVFMCGDSAWSTLKDAGQVHFLEYR